MDEEEYIQLNMENLNRVLTKEETIKLLIESGWTVDEAIQSWREEVE